MWIIQEANKVALWNKRHFEERKTEIMQHVQNIQYRYLLNKYLKGAGLVAWEAAEYIYSVRTESVNDSTHATHEIYRLATQCLRRREIEADLIGGLAKKVCHWKIKLKMKYIQAQFKSHLAFNQTFSCMKYRRARLRPISLIPLLLWPSRLSFETIKEHYRKPLGAWNPVPSATGLISFLRINFYFLGWM
jgi:hypothetical protein